MFKSMVKHSLGKVAIRIFPVRAGEIERNISAGPSSVLDRIIRAGLIRDRREHEAISRLHHRIWAGEEGAAFARHHGDRFNNWFLTNHLSIVDELERIIAECRDRYNCLYEIGCGDGQLVHYLSNRLVLVDHFVGIDINEAVIIGNRRKLSSEHLEFVCASAADWICRNSRPRSVFFSNGGVLEYFPETEIAGLLKKISTDLKPAIFAIVEPLAPDYDLKMETASRPYGSEWSFTHNYAHLFESNGFATCYQHETMTGGYRWLLMVLRTVD